MTLPHIQIARAHWLLGALFLAIVLEEDLPLLRRDGRLERTHSIMVPWMLMLGGVGVRATTVFAGPACVRQGRCFLDHEKANFLPDQCGWFGRIGLRDVYGCHSVR